MSESGGSVNRKRQVQAHEGHGNSATTTTSSGKKKQKKGSRSGGHPVVYESPGVVISRSAEDCAPQLSLSKDQLTITGNKGFRMARATHGVSNGAWYWECTVLSPETREGHCRLGWSMRTGSLQAPVGYDKFSYAYRDIAGSKVHESLRTDNYGAPWEAGDVIGFFIKIKQEEAKDSSALEVASDSGRLGVEEAAAALSAGNAANGRSLGNAANEIRFFKNGEDQGVAFSGIAPGTYFPAVSLYMGGSVRVNFGPEFVYPPPSSLRVKPISSLKALTKEETKAQRSRIKQERAMRGLEPARVRGVATGATNGSSRLSTTAGAKGEKNPTWGQTQGTRSRSKSPAPRLEDNPDIDADASIGGGGGGRGDDAKASPGLGDEREESKGYLGQDGENPEIEGPLGDGGDGSKSEGVDKVAIGDDDPEVVDGTDS